MYLWIYITYTYDYITTTKTVIFSKIHIYATKKYAQKNISKNHLAPVKPHFKNRTWWKKQINYIKQEIVH